MGHEIAIFIQLAMVFGVASFAVLASKALRLPSVVGFLLAGIFMGPQGLDLVPDFAGLEALNETAIVFLMFTIGLEFSVGSIGQLKKAFFGVGLIQVTATVLIVAALMGKMLGVGREPAVVAGYMIALSSTAIIMKILHDTHELASPHGNATLGVLLLQDVVAIPMMLSLPLLAGGRTSQIFQAPSSFFSFLAELLVIGVVVAIGARVVVPRVLKVVAESRSRELFFFTVLFMCFGFGVLAAKAGFSVPLGAFIAGVMVAGSPFGRQASSEIIPLRDNFLGFFFISLGILLDLRFFFFNVHGILALAVVLLLIKVGVTYLAAKAVRYADKVAIMVSLLLFQVGEFAFIIAKEANKLEILSREQFQYFLSVSLLSMIVSPVVFRVAPAVAGWLAPDRNWRGAKRRDRALATEVKSVHPAMTDHAILIGYGLVGRMTADAFENAEIPFCVVDLNYRAITNLKKRGINAVYGDASRDEILEAAGVDRAALIVVAVAGRHMVPAIVAALERHHSRGHLIVRCVYEREAIEIQALRPGIDVVIAEVESAKVLTERALRVFKATPHDGI